MYKHKLINESNVFQLGMTLPVNTSATASTAVRAAGAPGRLAITVRAADANVVLADIKKLTISLLTSLTEGGSYVAPKNNPTMVVTMDAALAAEDEEWLGSLIIPIGHQFQGDELTDKWVKAVIATDDAAAAGLIDVFLEYLAN